MGKLKKETIAAPLTKRKGAAVMWLVTIALIPMVLGYFLYTAEVDQSGIDLPQMPTVTPVPPGSQVTNITIGDIGNEEAAPAPTALPLPTPDGRIDELAAGAQQQTLSIERLTDRVSLQETAVAELVDQVEVEVSTADDEREEIAAGVLALKSDLAIMGHLQNESEQSIAWLSYGGVGVVSMVAIAALWSIFGNSRVITTELRELPEVSQQSESLVITDNSDVITNNSPVNTPRFEFYDLLKGYFTNSEIATISSNNMDRNNLPQWFIAGVRKMDSDPDIGRMQIATAVKMAGSRYAKLKEVLDLGD